LMSPSFTLSFCAKARLETITNASTIDFFILS
jgi:hypothetical protein